MEHDPLEDTQCMDAIDLRYRRVEGRSMQREHLPREDLTLVMPHGSIVYDPWATAR